MVGYELESKPLSDIYYINNKETAIFILIVSAADTAPKRSLQPGSCTLRLRYRPRRANFSDDIEDESS